MSPFAKCAMAFSFWPASHRDRRDRNGIRQIRVQRTEQFAERLAVQAISSARSNADTVASRSEGTGWCRFRRFLRPRSEYLLQHQLANVFEADRNFVQLAIEFRGKLIDQLGHGKRLGNIAGSLRVPARCQTSSAKIWCGLTNDPSRRQRRCGRHRHRAECGVVLSCATAWRAASMCGSMGSGECLRNVDRAFANFIAGDAVRVNSS